MEAEYIILTTLLLLTEYFNNDIILPLLLLNSLLPSMFQRGHTLIHETVIKLLLFCKVEFSPAIKYPSIINCGTGCLLIQQIHCFGIAHPCFKLIEFKHLIQEIHRFLIVLLINLKIFLKSFVESQDILLREFLLELSLNDVFLYFEKLFKNLHVFMLIFIYVGIEHLAVFGKKFLVCHYELPVSHQLTHSFENLY